MPSCGYVRLRLLVDLDRAAKLLWDRVPDPPPTRAKPAKSWKLLKPGQHLALTKPMAVANHWLDTGTVVKVVSVDTQSAELTVVHTDTKFLWTNPDWKSQFERVRKPKKAKQ